MIILGTGEAAGKIDWSAFLKRQHTPTASKIYIWASLDFPSGSSSKEHACQPRRPKRRSFDPWVGKIPWRRAWQPTPVLLPGEFHGQRSLVGYGAWGRKELDTTEVTDHTHKFRSGFMRNALNSLCVFET